MIVKSDLMLNDREHVSSRAVLKQYPNKSRPLCFKISFYKTGKNLPPNGQDTKEAFGDTAVSFCSYYEIYPLE